MGGWNLPSDLYSIRTWWVYGTHVLYGETYERMKEDLLYKLDRGWLGGSQRIQILSLIVIFPLVGERGQASPNPIGDPPLSQISVVLHPSLPLVSCVSVVTLLSTSLVCWPVLGKLLDSYRKFSYPSSTQSDFQIFYHLLKMWAGTRFFFIRLHFLFRNFCNRPWVWDDVSLQEVLN